MNTLNDKTIDFILKSLNYNNLEYAVLRNFEKLPSIGRDLDIIINKKKNKKRYFKVFHKAYKKFNWDLLIIDKSKSSNYSDKKKIIMYYFLNLKTLDFLQIDLFYSLSVLGTPYFELQNDKNIILYKKKYKILNPKISKTYHLFQINSLINNVNLNKKKINEYINKYLKINKNLLYKKKIIFEYFFLNKIDLNLKKKNYLKFKIYINIYRFLIFTKFFFSNPTRLFLIPYKLYEKFLLYFVQPTGFILKHSSDENDKKKLEQFLNKLKKKNIINDWCYKKNLNFLKKILYLEKRNIIVDFKIIKVNRKNFKKFFFKKFLERKNIEYFGKT